MGIDIPFNVLTKIISYSDRNDQIKLSQVSRELNYIVSSRIYKTIMVVDTLYQASGSDQPYTLVRTCELSEFTRCLNVHNFMFVDKIIINTHDPEICAPLTGLFQKLSDLWAYCNHVISFVNYDISSLRVAHSFNNYLESSSIQFSEYDDGNYILAQKSRKILNLRDWFAFEISDFLVAPASDKLQRLGIYIESNRYQANADEGFSIEKPDFDNARTNLASLSELFLHSALGFVKFMDLIQNLNIPQMQLRRLSITSTHRLRNDAKLDFAQIMRYFNLNELEEFELKINCGRQHECMDSCMVKFFDDWKSYNLLHGLETNIRKFSLVHHKSLTETAQFKQIVENYVLDSHFSKVREIYLNLSNTVHSPASHFTINLEKVLDKVAYVPELEVLHISSFMCEWSWGRLFKKQGLLSHHDILVNRCPCEECKVTRASFIELAALDRAKNYSHKVKLSDIGPSLSPIESNVDFSLIENVKFLKYVTSMMKKEESIMERNLTSSGTMLDMEYMPVCKNSEMKLFETLIEHSCLRDTFQYMARHLHQLRRVNFGGIELMS